MILIICVWLLWFAFRVFLQRSKHFKYDFDGIHHSDAGFPMLMCGMLLGSNVWFWCGVTLIVDDAAGHWRSARGEPEVWLLEWIFLPIINVIYRWIKK